MGRRKKMAEEVTGQVDEDMDNEIEISDFFTSANENEGSWHEPVIFGIPLGLEFKIIGARSIEAEMIGEYQSREMEKISLITSDKERAEANKKLLNEVATKLVVGLRTKNGKVVKLHGVPVTFDKKTILEICEKQPQIPNDILSYSRNGANFIGKKSD
ncbi:MAG: hypothetical protein M0R51_09830 [Clostridia bacterium]|nr:hypothetical protein [Clostridia bacterium]